MSDKYYYRYATAEDVDLIFIWANEKSVRANSFCSDEIKYEDHVKWYNNLLADSEHNCQLILMDEGIPVGQCRLRIEGDTAEIGMSVDRDYRGSGVGNIVIAKACEWAKVNRPDIKKIIARVKPENETSMKTFINAGFAETYRNFEIDL